MSDPTKPPVQPAPPSDLQVRNSDAAGYLDSGQLQKYLDQNIPRADGGSVAEQMFQQQFGRQPNLADEKDYNALLETVINSKYRNRPEFKFNHNPDDDLVPEPGREDFGEMAEWLAAQRFYADPSVSNAMRLYHIIKPKPTPSS